MFRKGNFTRAETSAHTHPMDRGLAQKPILGKTVSGSRPGGKPAPASSVLFHIDTGVAS